MTGKSKTAIQVQRAKSAGWKVSPFESVWNPPLSFQGWPGQDSFTCYQWKKAGRCLAGKPFPSMPSS